MEKKKVNFNKDHVYIAIGINISLLAALLMISNWSPWFDFIAKGLAFVFGFVGFWIFVPALFLLGIYIALKKKLVHFKVGTSFVGLFLIIFAVGLLTSNFATKPLEIIHLTPSGAEYCTQQNEVLSWNGAIPSFMAIFNKAFDGKDASQYRIEYGVIDKGVTCSALGGGFFCFIFLGLFNNISQGTSVLLTVISVILLVVGLCLVLNRLIAKGIAAIKNRKTNKKEPSKSKDIEYQEVQATDEYSSYNEVKQISAEPQQSHEISPAPAPQADYEKYRIIDEPETKETLDPHELAIRRTASFNNQNALRPASFNFDSNEQREDDGLISPAQNNTNQYQPQTDEIESYNEFNNDKKEDPQPIVDFETDNSDFLGQEEEKEEVITESIESFNPPIYEEPAVSSPVQQAPVYQAPVQQTPVAPAPAQPKPMPDPTERQPIQLHWEDDDEIEVEIPKATPLPPYKFPDIGLLDPHENADDKNKNIESSESRLVLINGILSELRVGAEATGYTVGPSVTQFDIKMKEGQRVESVAKIVDDFSVRLGGIPCRYQKVVANKTTSCLEVPNEYRTNVGLYEALKTYPAPTGEGYDLTVPFGKDVQGDLVNLKVDGFPHLLVAGTTGSGKSVFMHCLIISLIMRNRPEDVKILLIDPKGVEMSFYKKIPHLICPMIDDPSKAGVAMKKLIEEMNRRNTIFKAAGVKELKDFNNKAAKKYGYKRMPSIVVFVDEFADLKERCKDIESSILQIAQKARTVGIHLVIATQRPSTDVISGVIKSNLPSRVALRVSKQVDSQTILGEAGAETLLGNGDMLVDATKLAGRGFIRVQSPFVDTMEINAVCNFLRSNYSPMYWNEFHDLTDHSNDVSDAQFTPSQIEKNATDDQLYTNIKADVMLRQYCSISFIQRSYSVGFPKAGKIFARLQQEGIVDKVAESAAKGCKVLVHSVSDEPSENLGSIEQSELVRDFDPYKQ